MFGKIIMIILMLMSALTSGLYLFGKKENKDVLYLSSKTFYGLIFGIIFICSFFMMNIINHNFQYSYVYQYSSKMLSWQLLISSFFAGQQGSLMLWLLIFAIFGLFLSPYVKKHNYESEFLGIYSLIIFFLLLMLVFKSPFEFVWETFPNAGFDAKNLPLEGKGLNPVLENLWIVIHPPILFTGYTAISIPFDFAIAALFKRDYTGWLELSKPWILFASFSLGLGLILGGMWAYETLGWGGFWGWDPVENSSFVPWLSITALIHLALIQKRSNALIKINFLIAILSFVLVLYASFLTRSGILGNMSVHSFTDPGAAVYSLLLSMLIIFSLIGLYSYLLRKKDIKQSKIEFKLNKESLVFYGSIAIIAMLIIVLVGTSLPIITELASEKSTVDSTFYDKWGIGLVSLILYFISISIYLPWKSKEKVNFKKIAIIFVISIILTSIFSVITPKFGSYYLLISSAIFSLIANIDILIQKKFKKFGSNLSHIGISLFILGLVLLNSMSQIKTFTFKFNNPINDFGYKMTLIDKIEIEKNKPDRQKFIYRIKCENYSENFFADPVVYWSDFNMRKAPIIEPFIKRSLFSDLYVVLKSSQNKGTISSFSLLKNQIANIDKDTNFKISYTAFDMQHFAVTSKDAKVGIFVNIQNGEFNYTDTLYTKLIEGSINADLNWKKITNSNTDIALIKIVPNKEDITKSEAVIMTKPSNQSYSEAIGEELFVEFSIKPGINLIWFGLGLIILGALLSYSKQKENIIS